MDIRENILLSTETTFRTGGPGRFFLELEEPGEIESAVAFAEKQNLPLMPFGGGSNLLVPDSGLEKVLVRQTRKEIKKTSDEIHVDAGVTWDAFVEWAGKEGLWGIENLSGIPGTVGAGIVQNIGAYAQAVGEHVVRVEAHDTKKHELVSFSRSECDFRYRMSLFKKEVDRYIITKVIFSLSGEAKPNLAYRDLKKFLEEAHQTPTLELIREWVLSIRKEKFPPLDRYGTAGSFFLNPIVQQHEVDEIKKRFPEIPVFDMPEGGVKVPLAWIFDHMMNFKGLKVGKAFVWPEQPLVIATEEGGVAEEVVQLSQKMAKDVHEKIGLIIRPEVRMFGAETKIQEN